MKHLSMDMHQIISVEIVDKKLENESGVWTCKSLIITDKNGDVFRINCHMEEKQPQGVKLSRTKTGSTVTLKKSIHKVAPTGRG